MVGELCVFVSWIFGWSPCEFLILILIWCDARVLLDEDLCLQYILFINVIDVSFPFLLFEIHHVNYCTAQIYPVFPQPPEKRSKHHPFHPIASYPPSTILFLGNKLFSSRLTGAGNRTPRQRGLMFPCLHSTYLPKRRLCADLFVGIWPPHPWSSVKAVSQLFLWMCFEFS